MQFNEEDKVKMKSKSLSWNPGVNFSGTRFNIVDSSKLSSRMPKPKLGTDKMSFTK